jgi:F0F1-type ATP synthase membrane subunit a
METTAQGQGNSIGLTLAHYSYLQVLDFLTTVAFLVQGVQEGNPLVRMAMKLTPNPMAGLLIVKLAAVFLGVYCWWGGRGQILRRINMLFAAVVAWNLVSLIVGSAHVQN